MAARERRFIAVDLGASAGRVFAGLVGEQQVCMEELARFDNQPVALRGTVYWDVLSLFSQIKRGLAEFARRYGPQADGIGLDTWGVDFGLIGTDGALLANPVHYRDRRTEGMMEQVFARIPARQVYQITGIQFLQLNTIYQLMAMVQAGSPVLAAARTLLFIPDLFNYFLTGRCVSEQTIASTSQMLEAGRPRWSQTILQALGLRSEMMPAILPPASVVGPLAADVAEEVGLKPAPVIAPACHDTAAAVAAVPAEPGGDWAFVSSGTWSLMGVELAEPLISDQSLAENFTNEAGVAGTIRFLRNIAGLWSLQQCRKVWRGRGHSQSFRDLSAAARRAQPFRSLVDPDAKCFLDPPDMTAAIADFCRRTGQPRPETPGQFVRCIYESLALAYRRTLDRLRQLTGRQIRVLHIVGGGSRDALLGRMAADACGLPVVAGPAEATSLGNVLVQAMATGRIGSLEHARAVVRESCSLRSYRPRQTHAWQQQLARFAELRESDSP